MALLEFTLIGSGVGECILVKNLENKWIIIDSCIDPKTKNPVALDYLNSKSISLNDVDYVVATHWHDDHVKGLSGVVDKCVNAKVVLSASLQAEEFVAILATNDKHQRVLKTLTSGVQELYKIFDSLEKTATLNRISWACSNKVFANNTKFKFYSLSPSDLEITSAKKDFKDLFPVEGDSLTNLVKKNPNHSSVVTWIELEDLKMICGADLEVTGATDSGWENIKSNSTVVNFNQPNIVKVKKVAHHGSPNGYLQPFWQVTVDANTYCLLTPYSRSHLPKPADLKRIAQHTENVFCTANSKGMKYRASNPTVQRTIKEATVSHKVISSDVGRVTLLIDSASGNVEIEKNGPADHYSNFLNP